MLISAWGTGGFRVWGRALTGSDDTLDNTHLMRMAGRSSRRLHGYAKAKSIPAKNIVQRIGRHADTDQALAQLPRFEDRILISCGLAGAFSDYFWLIGRFLLSWLAPFSPGESTFHWVPKPGGYIFDLV